MGDLAGLDLLVLGLLGIAALRGLWIGLIREVFSLTALVGACLAVRFLTVPFAEWLATQGLFEMSPVVARLVAGAGLAIGILVVAAIAGRLLRRGARAVGLGFLDRLGGAVLGLGEGAVVAAIVLVVALFALGHDHELLTDSRSIQALANSGKVLSVFPSFGDAGDAGDAPE